MTEAKRLCAERGSIVLPVQSDGMYQFIKAQLVGSPSSNDLYLGMNLTSKRYTDNTPYNEESYDFQGQNSKFKAGHDCAYMKKGIGFIPRSTSCDKKFQFYCLWKGI